jgi:hypothetical protein
MHNTQWLTARMVGILLANRASAISGELITEVVRGVLDEHRLDVRHPAPESVLREARHRLERLERARSDNTLNRTVPRHMG